MYKKFFKRVIDFTVAFVGLIVISPLFILLILFLAIANRGQVFFTQERPGKNGKIFRVIKFKTMNDKRDDNGNLLPNEQRVTKVGLFMRKTSLDELPQLFNILNCTMSLIGPRPLPVRYLQLYTPTQARRHEVLPGISGWAQVNGRNAISWTKKFECDVWYVDNISLRTDIKILWMTFLGVIRSKSIDAQGRVGGESFNGNN